MKKSFLFIALLLVLSVSSFATNYVGGIDVAPVYVAGDTTTPFAIHLSASGLTALSDYTVKIRMGNATTGGAFTNTWAGANGWLHDSSPYTAFTTPECNVVSDGSGAASKWFFARCSTALVGVVTTNIRIRLVGTSTNVDGPSIAIQTVLNMATEGGWLEGNYNGAVNKIVLIKNAGGVVLGTGVTEDNSIADGNTATSGYFKIALPAGTDTYTISLRNLDNSSADSDYSLGSQTITAGASTNIGNVPVELSGFNAE